MKISLKKLFASGHDENKADNVFFVKSENFTQFTDELEKKLKAAKLNPSEIVVALLLTEEVFFRLENHADKPEEFSAKVSLKKTFGRIRIIMSAVGKPYNPLSMWEDELKDEAISYAILRAHDKKLKYSRDKHNRENIVTITPKETTLTEARNIFVGIFVGILFGAVINGFADQKTIDIIENSYINPIQEVFVHALMMVLAPMIFFSVVSGISGISRSANVERLGARLVLISLLKLAFCVAAGMGMGYLLGAMTELLPTLESGSPMPPSAGISLSALIFGIVPGNMISPFSTNNIMQTLFLACFFGVILHHMDGDVKWAHDGLDFMTKISLKALSVVTLVLPFLVAISTAEMVMRLGISGFLHYGRLLIYIALGFPLTFAVSSVLVACFSKFSPLIFLKKAAFFSIIPFSMSNSSACLPATLNFCSKKLGIKESITKFSVPVGMQLNMDGTAYYVSLISMMLALTFGVTPNVDFLFSLFFVEFIMALTGIGLLVMPPVLESMGIPGSAVMHFVGIEPIMDMPATAQNVVGNITSSFLLAVGEGEIEDDVYNEK